MHSTCSVTYKGKGLTIDCGIDWLGKLDRLNPKAVIVSHGHPDHAQGLRDGCPCPVYATSETWDVINEYPIEDKRTIKARVKTKIRGLWVEAFPVLHSTRAPAVGYRITGGKVTIFYVPDVAYIEDRSEALNAVKLYVGDGASIERPFIRKPGETIIGHAPVQTQLTWCKNEGVPRALFTHCGSEIVKEHERTVRARIQDLAEERGVSAGVAYDGMEVVVR